jgi:hypothetical protein
MEGMPNRKQRRALAKQAGMIKLKQNASLAKKLEISKRAREFGNRIHLANVERNLRDQDQVILDKEQAQILQLIEEGHSPEEALAAIQKENEHNQLDGNMDSIGE